MVVCARMSIAALFVLLFAGQAGAESALARLQDDNPTPLKVFTPAGQDTPRLVGGLSITLAGPDTAARAGRFAASYRDVFLPAGDPSTLRVRRVVPTPFGRVAQLEQLVDGIPVFGGTLAVSENHHGTIRLAVNGLRPLGAAIERHEALPPAAEVTARLLASLGDRVRGAPRIETVWWPGRAGLQKVHAVTVPLASPTEEATYLVGGPEGTTGLVFSRTPNVLGYAYPANPLRGPYEEVELLHLGSAEHLSGEHVEVYNCTGSNPNSCSVHQQLAAPDENDNYLILPEGDDDPDKPDDTFVEVQAYYAINTIHDYFVDLGIAPTPITVGVNYPIPDGPNAFFSPQDQTFGGPVIMMGQWQTIDLAVENDVIFHEYGHHVFDIQSSTGMFEMDEYGPTFLGLAVNEATADYYSCSALDDPVLGEYFADRLGSMYFPEGYLRKVDNDLHCPRGLYGEPHDDGMVWSGFVWQVREMLGKEQADTLYMDVISHFPGTIDFPTATRVFLERAAEVLDADTVARIEALAEERGVIDCERFISVTRFGHTGYVMGRGMLPGMIKESIPLLPAELHYFVEVPEGAGRLDIDWSTRPYGNVDVILLVREDQPVTHEFGWQTGMDSHYDFKLEEGGQFDLRDPDPLTPFEPGHTYYFHPCNRDDRPTEYVIQGGVSEVDTDGGSPDAGTDGGTADGGADAGADTASPDAGPADAGTGADGEKPECTEGFGLAWDGVAWVCVPDCKDGYSPEKEGDKWVCVKNDEGCGCTSSGAGASLLLLALAGLAMARRRKQ